MKEIMTNIGNEKSPNRVHRTIVPIVPVPPVKNIQTINNQSLRAGTIKISLSRGPIFQHFIVVFAAESPYLWYRRMLEWIAPQEYTTNSTDDEAWQAQNQITQNDSEIGVF